MLADRSLRCRLFLVSAVVCYAEGMAKGSGPLERMHAFDSIQQVLEAVEPACGAGFYECLSQKSEGFHYCCAAKRIAEPDTGALLSYPEFADTLRHYRQQSRQVSAWDLFVEYVSSACLLETWEELEQAEDRLEAIVVEIDEGEANGEKLPWDFYERMNIASKEIDAVRKKSREKAKRLAVALK